jgi:UDP-N-acetylglucosamine 2-epimerase (non-hydrolysing)/GDP/UDP-N,N'-diacetylbacillosamine 2-epimerase (hydrolysing)
MPREITHSSRRRICFVTGTRAEFGLMKPVLRAINNSRRLQLQILATGMHLDRRRGYSLNEIRREGWKVDAVIPWEQPAASFGGQALAHATGEATVGLADALAALDPDVVLVVGDRVEAFAGATAGHLSGRVVAHVHGGDRALGQVDDSLRHAITKLAHIHFPATAKSAHRILKMGEDCRRIYRAGSPGVDGIVEAAADRVELAKEFPGLRPYRFAMILLHPVDADEAIEFDRATMIFDAVAHTGIENIVIIHPNNDPGSAGIIRAWQAIKIAEGKSDRPLSAASKIGRAVEKANNPFLDGTENARVFVIPNINRAVFLGMLRDAAMLVGNSSSGIIEAGSFRTPVIDIGPRQNGRERNRDVVNVPYKAGEIRRAIQKIWNAGKPRRGRHANVYGGRGAGEKIASALESLQIDEKLLRKLIRY